MPHPEDAEQPLEGDPVAGLPVTDADASLVTTTLDPRRSVQILDLRAEETLDLGVDVQEFGSFAATDVGIWVEVDDGSVVLVDWDSRAPIATAELPSLFDPRSMYAFHDGTLVVTYDSSPSLTVLVDADGTARCRMDGGLTPFGLVVDRELWTFDARRIDLSSCADLGAVVGDDGSGWAVGAAAGDVVYRGGSTGVKRLERQADGTFAVDGRLDLTGELWDVVVVDGDPWIAMGEVLVQADPDTLEPREQVPVARSCAEYLRLAVVDASIFVVNECEGTLSRVDAAEATVSGVWGLPDDGGDHELRVVPVDDDGLWFADVEQTGEPFHFDADEDRFERLPDGVRSADLYGFFLDVRRR